MEFIPTAIPEVVLVKSEAFSDARGFVMETYRASHFAGAGLRDPFVQDNHTFSRKGTLRGLHYQIRHSQGKLIRAVSGEVFDVAVDLRRRSPTFGRWVAARLSPETRDQLWIPPGFAHGLYVLSATAEVIYKMTDYYAPEWERTLLWSDPQVGIAWPLEGNGPPLLSDKDAHAVLLAQAEVFEWTPRR